MVKIIPAILTANPQELRRRLTLAEGVVDRVQIDIIDGQFANNRTVDPSLLENLETDLNLDFHLMTKEPVDWVERCIRAGADRIIGQIELMSDQIAFMGKVQEVGSQVGLAVDLDTPISAIDPTILTNLDVVLLMAVKAGFGEQKFNDKVIKKIKELDKIRIRDDTPFAICVDGGETEEVVDDTWLSGADEVVVGSRLFNGDLAANIEKFMKAAVK